MPWAGSLANLGFMELSLRSLRGRRLAPGLVLSCRGRHHACTAYALNPLNASQSHLIPSGMIKNSDMCSRGPWREARGPLCMQTSRMCLYLPFWREEKGPSWSWSSGGVEQRLEAPSKGV